MLMSIESCRRSVRWPTRPSIRPSKLHKVPLRSIHLPHFYLKQNKTKMIMSYSYPEKVCCCRWCGTAASSSPAAAAALVHKEVSYFVSRAGAMRECWGYCCRSLSIRHPSLSTLIQSRWEKQQCSSLSLIHSLHWRKKGRKEKKIQTNEFQFVYLLTLMKANVCT